MEQEIKKKRKSPIAILSQNHDQKSTNSKTHTGAGPVDALSSQTRSLLGVAISNRMKRQKEKDSPVPLPCCLGDIIHSLPIVKVHFHFFLIRAEKGPFGFTLSSLDAATRVADMRESFSFGRFSLSDFTLSSFSGPSAVSVQPAAAKAPNPVASWVWDGNIFIG